MLADSSVVTLALPAILREFDATVNGVAWVLIAFNLALALFALGGARLSRGRARGAFAGSVGLFVLTCLACAAAPSLEVLIAARAAQGLCGAVVVAAALALMVRSVGRRRAIALWAGAGVLGAAIGPAAGGFLTELLSWEAMFALQAPLALLGLLGLAGARVPPAVAAAPAAPAARPAVAPLVALTLASAALSAALFLLVILLIEGWRHSPGEAALAVTVMPAAALLAGGWARAHHRLVPAIAGMLLVAGGLAALGYLPGAAVAWTFAPQVAIGLGLGLALATLIGGSVGEAGALAGPAAWTIAARHAGIVIGLLALTPIFTADLDAVSAPVQQAGFARVLDAPISLPAKIDVARELDRQVDASAGAQELPDLDAAFARLKVDAGERPAVDRLQAQLDDELDRGATDAFSRSFRVAALLALLAAGAALLGALRRLGAARAERPRRTAARHAGWPSRCPARRRPRRCSSPPTSGSAAATSPRARWPTRARSARGRPASSAPSSPRWRCSTAPPARCARRARPSCARCSSAAGRRASRRTSSSTRSATASTAPATSGRSVRWRRPGCASAFVWAARWASSD